MHSKDVLGDAVWPPHLSTWEQRLGGGRVTACASGGCIWGMGESCLGVDGCIYFQKCKENMEVFEKKLHVDPASFMTKRKQSPGAPASLWAAGLGMLWSLQKTKG